MRMLRFLSGFFVGLILGAAVVMLITPQSGQDMQQKLKAQAEPYLSEGRKAFATRKAELEEKMAKIQAGNTL